MIGTCENCDRQNVPVSNGISCGCETTQCFICQGDTDADPYGELDGAPLIITGTADDIAELLCGPRQHNDHCKGWRHHLYIRDYDRRDAAVRAWAKQLIARANDEREARENSYQQAAE